MSHRHTGRTPVALLEAALKVAAQHGVRGITHRKVVAQAAISLGSTSYYFASLDELVLEAFRHFSKLERERHDGLFETADSRDEIVDAILQLVVTQSANTERAILLYELYAQGVRDHRYAEIVCDWSRMMAARLEARYSREVAAHIEVLIEGLTFQQLMGASALSDARARFIVNNALDGIRISVRRHKSVPIEANTIY